jgi:hypothetical protein
LVLSRTARKVTAAQQRNNTRARAKGKSAAVASLGFGNWGDDVVRIYPFLLARNSKYLKLKPDVKEKQEEEIWVSGAPASAARSNKEWFASARSAADPLRKLAPNFTPISNTFTHAPAATIDSELARLSARVAAVDAAGGLGLGAISRWSTPLRLDDCGAAGMAADVAFLRVTGIS